MPAADFIQKLNSYQCAPALLGFGISTPEQVQAALQAGAKGAISGSAVVKIIENNLAEPAQMLSQLADFCQSMKAATQL